MPLTKAWTKLRYHEQQSKAWRTDKRFVALACGRGSGKTELARRRIVRYLPVKKPWPDPLYFYALPTIAQAKKIAWKPLLALIPPEWIEDINRADLTITTKFGSELRLIGLDKPMRAEGVQYDGGVIDESSDVKPKTFETTFMPAFSHRKAWCWRIGVPKRFGIGAGEFKAFCKDPGPEGIHFTWTSEDILDADAIALAKEMLTERDYNEQYLASWEKASGAIFYAFCEVGNVSNQICYLPDLPICIGSDFNVDPMCWVIGHRVDNELHIFDELVIRNTNTRETLDTLFKKYGHHKSGFEFFGDASGSARKTAADTTDYLLIKNDNRFNPSAVYYPRKNPAIAARFASCNSLFLNAKGQRRFFVHPRCTNLIADLIARSYKQGTREPDDYGDIGHITDGLGYIIHRAFPIRLSTQETPKASVA